MNWPVLIHLPAIAPVVAKVHTIHGALYWILEIPQGIFWIYAYIMLIQRAAVDKFVGMPVVALGLNYGWEFVFAFILPNPPTQKMVDVAWVGLDTLILVQALKYGRKDYLSFPARAFPAALLSLVAYGTLLQLAAGYEFADYYGIYGSFGVNAYMSYAFIAMLRRRKSSAGQSMHVAISKCIGSATVGVMFFVMFPGRLLLSLLAVTVLAFDLVYIRLLYRQIRSEGASPWVVSRPPVILAAASEPLHDLGTRKAGIR